MLDTRVSTRRPHYNPGVSEVSGSFRSTRARRLAALLTGAALLLTACGQGKAGTAIADGDDAATYVSEKFAEQLGKLGDQFTGDRPRKSTLDRYARVDDKDSDSTITGIQLGKPPARLSTNRSKETPEEYLDSFHPAGSTVEYLKLGPVYASLAPTPWVSMPYNGDQYDECFWGGQQDVCKMVSAVTEATQSPKARAAKSAKRLDDGTVELNADITLRLFLKHRVVVFPQNLIDLMSESMQEEPIPTKITIDAQGTIKAIEMNAKIAKDGHEVEIRMHYQHQGEPTERDLPEVPPEAEVTALKTDAEVNDFYDRMGEIQGN
ncbi:hypothetical protein YIM_44005 [Amycolatopsis sp. YIM 10]|nr:hypothetical protein YIM_44005 [Amycolatopsis sp. YIM 10]